MAQGKETMEGQLIIFGEALFIKQYKKLGVSVNVYLDKKKKSQQITIQNKKGQQIPQALHVFRLFLEPYKDPANQEQ